MNMVFMSRYRLPLALTTVTAVAATGIGFAAVHSSADERDSDGRLSVVASFYPMEYLAERIGGSRVDLTELTAPGVEPHDLELTPKQVAQVGAADVVLHLKGLQPAVDTAVDRAEPAHAVDAASYAPLEQHGAEQDGAEQDGAEHDADPHIWLDPERYAEVAQGVGDSLAAADPAHASHYRANTAAVVADLTALDREFSTGLAGCPSTDFLTSHSAFGYLADAYGLRQLSVSGLDPETEPSAARLAEVKTEARQHGITTVFTEPLAGTRLADTLADELGLRTATLDPLESAPAEGDYLSAMRANLSALRNALGCTS